MRLEAKNAQVTFDSLDGESSTLIIRDKTGRILISQNITPKASTTNISQPLGWDEVYE